MSVGSGVDGLGDGVLLLLERNSSLQTDGGAELDIVDELSLVRSLPELDLVATTLGTSRPVGSSSVARLSSEVGDVELDGSDGSISTEVLEVDDFEYWMFSKRVNGDVDNFVPLRVEVVVLDFRSSLRNVGEE